MGIGGVLDSHSRLGVVLVSAETEHAPFPLRGGEVRRATTRATLRNNTESGRTGCMRMKRWAWWRTKSIFDFLTILTLLDDVILTI